jgi:hypothetical protein
MGRAGRMQVEQNFNLDYEAHWLYQVMTDRLNGKTVGLRPHHLKDAESEKSSNQFSH